MSRPTAQFFILPFSIFLLLVAHAGMGSCTWTWYRDADGDGFGNPYVSTTTACGAAAPVGYVSNNIDANDAIAGSPVWYGSTNHVLSTTGEAPEIIFSADSTPYTMLAKIATNKLSVLKMTSGTWGLVGAEDFSGVLANMTSGSLVFDQNTPYVSYADMSGAAVVMSYNGTSWQNVGSTGTASVTETDIAIYNGEPYVTYKSGSGLYVMKYSSGSWVPVGVGNVGTGDYPKIIVGSNGVAYVAFSDGASGAEGKLTVKKFDYTLLTWVDVGVRDFSSSGIDPSLSLVQDGNNVVYVAYYDQLLDEVIVQQYSEGLGTWVSLGDTIYKGEPADLSLSVDYWGNPYLAYSDGVTNNYVVKKMVSNHWVAVGPDPINRSTGVRVFGSSISIAVTAGGVPYISFIDDNSSSFISTMELQDSSSPLPVTLVYFKASAKKDDDVSLSWSTASEKDFDYFLLERSVDGRNFAAIGKVPGSNKGVQTEEYSYDDHYPNIGMNYYRLVSIDLNGSYEYSKIIAVEIKPSSLRLLTLYPNPSTGDYINIRLGADPLPGDYIQIISMLGNMIYTVQAEEITLEIVFNTRLTSGQYIVNYFSKEQQFSSRMVVVQ